MDISFVILTYNQEQYIEECLSSLYYQQKKYNQQENRVQVIISDDASSDNTIVKINNWVNKFKDEFADIQVLNSEYNRGICGNFLSALSKAEGDYIKFLAGDDMLPDRSIAYIVKYLDKFDIVYGLPYTFFEFQRNDNAMQLRRLEKIHVRYMSEMNDSYYDRIHRRCFLHAGATYVSKDLLRDKHVISMLRTYNFIDDYAQYLAFSEIKDIRVLYFPEILYMYRRTNNSAYIIRREEVFREFLKIHEYALSTCKNNLDRLFIKNNIYCIKNGNSKYFHLESYRSFIKWMFGRTRFPLRITLGDLEKCEIYIQRIKSIAKNGLKYISKKECAE